MSLTRIGSILMAATGLVNSQTSPPSSSAQFEAVSIRPNRSGGDLTSIKPSQGGRLVARNVPLKMLMAWAYQVRNSQILKAPSWVDSEGYDVSAKAEGNPRFDRLQPTLEMMFQGVLAERFKLALHRETKELPIYKLLVSKRGTKIHQVAETDGSECFDRPSQEIPCGQVALPSPGQVTGQKASMGALVAVLSLMLDKTVIDQTGLKGSYDFTVNWKQEREVRAPLSGSTAPIAALDRQSVAADLADAMARAFDDQLGLELQPGRGPVEILVVDHVERPSEN